MQRGIVHVFRPLWSKRLPDGSRIVQRTKLWYWRFTAYGKRYSGGPGKPTQAEALAVGEKRKAEVCAGQEDDWRKLTLSGLYQMAGAYRVTWKPNTVAAFEGAWKRIFRHLPEMKLVQHVTEEALLRFVGARKAEGGRPSSIRLDLKHLRIAMNLAHRRRRLPWVPEFPRVADERREQTIRPDELETILREMPEHYRLFLEAAAEMGWRARSELATRRWTDVEWGPPGWVVLEARDSKTGERRVFPMTARLRGILETARVHVEAVQIRTGQVIPWVFCRPDGRPLGSYKGAWARALKRVGIGKLEGRRGPWSSARVVHDLRRTAIRRFEALGLPRNVSQGMVGHGSERTFSGYAGRGADPEALRRAAEMLDAAAGERETKVAQLSLFARR